MSGTGDPPPPTPAVPDTPSAEALRRQLTDTRAEMLQTVSAIDRGMQQQEADDRSMITRVVIKVFGFSIAGVLAVIIIGAWLSKDFTKVADNAVDLLKSVVLPIVTLVLGYYFGRAGKV